MEMEMEIEKHCAVSKVYFYFLTIFLTSIDKIELEMLVKYLPE